MQMWSQLLTCLDHEEKHHSIKHCVGEQNGQILPLVSAESELVRFAKHILALDVSRAFILGFEGQAEKVVLVHSLQNENRMLVMAAIALQILLSPYVSGVVMVESDYLQGIHVKSNVGHRIPPKWFWHVIWKTEETSNKQVDTLRQAQTYHKLR